MKNNIIQWVYIFLRTVISMQNSDFNVSISAEVPSHVDYGGKAELYCFHNLPENHLLFLKWYKDEEEFCRLSPQGNSLIFSVTGIYLKEGNCNERRVVLSNLTLNSTGFYKCELSTEGPPFRIFSDGKNMSVFVLPKKDPIISGVESIYRKGHYVSALCTTSPSIPPSDILWFINGKQAKDWQLLEFPMVNTGEGYTSSKLVRFQVLEPTILLCQATLPSLPPWQAAVFVPIETHSTSSSPLHLGHYKLIHLFTAVILLCIYIN